MSCRADSPTFRLLDCRVGWDVEGQLFETGLSGFDDEKGLRLARSEGGVNALETRAVLGFLPPRWLARGCTPREWYLVGEREGRPIARRRNPATGCFESLWPERCGAGPLEHPRAIAHWRHHIAIADDDAVYRFVRSGEKLVARLEISCPGAVAFSASGDMLVVDAPRRRVRRFLRAGGEKAAIKLPSGVAADSLHVANDGAVWITRRRGAVIDVWRAGRGRTQFARRSSVIDIRRGFTETSLVAATDEGFCIEACGGDGFSARCCYSRTGEPIASERVEPPEPPRRQVRGQLLTTAIDSGIPRCRWHRVRLDADVPEGTSVEVAVATSERSDAVPQGDASVDANWAAFAAGVPHPTDWQKQSGSSIDFLVRQPPGRYLYLRLRLSRQLDDFKTPEVRGIRLDFPRATSLEFLPDVYRENAEAEDFTERFLSLFDASIENLDRAIERFPALLDEGSVQDELLPWLGRFLDLTFDSEWSAEKRREILRALPTLFPKRGTVAGLQEAIRLVFGGERPVVRELAAERRYGALANARLGRVRLFSRSRSRFRLGASALGGAPLRSYGDPDQDPQMESSHRFVVSVPPATGTRITTDRLAKVIESQKPAHTLQSIQIGGQGFVVGPPVTLGVDTALSSPEPPTLGGRDGIVGTAELGRSSILRPSPRGARLTLRVGEASAVGVHTVME